MECNDCYWNYDDKCINDDRLVHSDVTQHTNKCIGYLDKEIENKVWTTYGERINLLGKCKLDELAEIKSFILNHKIRERNEHEK